MVDKKQPVRKADTSIDYHLEDMRLRAYDLYRRIHPDSPEEIESIKAFALIDLAIKLEEMHIELHDDLDFIGKMILEKS